MIFLISYDRQTQSLMRPVESFTEDERAEARRRRFEVQLALPEEQGRYEVVLLEASSDRDIRQTHARYFASNEEPLSAAVKADVRKMSAQLDERRRSRHRRKA